jgi:folate-binding protein YgfZ
MFQENPILLNYNDYLFQKFPNALIEKEDFSYLTSSNEEYSSLRNGVGLRINPDLKIIQFSGKDILDFLNRVSTNALLAVKMYDKINTLFLNEKGRFIDRTTFIPLEDRSLLIGSSDRENRLLSWLNKYIIMEDIKAEDFSGKYALIDIIGPQTESFLTMILGKEISISDEKRIRRFDVDGFTFYSFLNLEGNAVKFFRFLIEKERLLDFIDYLVGIKSVFDLSVVGKNAFDFFRIENLIPIYPNEINDLSNPYEVNLINEVNFTKGCYIGQEVIARLNTYSKVKRKLVKVKLIQEIFNSEPFTIVDDNSNQVGEITTLSKMNSFNEQKALALINIKAVDDKYNLFVNVEGKKFPLTII